VVELLEKRLRSRFSHRRVFLGAPASEGECQLLVAQGLGLPDSGALNASDNATKKSTGIVSGDSISGGSETGDEDEDE